ncbi:RRP15-like protein isoform X2 [Frieseomelitta varia]|uniref:RRP15-like protein isoform X2 n=1 Tax=Frieseomelitta varia TaxID=561572 RepID=UPI001CB67EC3|nr:RRP15-like protein isoform X2 [Frieseomelitta varia]
MATVCDKATTAINTNASPLRGASIFCVHNSNSIHMERKKSTKMKCAKMELEENNFEDDQSDDVKSDVEGNPGWADVMQKILQTNKPKRKRTIVLSKAKKLCDIKKNDEEEQLPFEIEEVKREIKTEESEEVENDNQKPLLKERRKGTKLGIRVKPSMMDREYERTLQKIAKRGVVQFFNAVKQQQDEINKKLSDAGPSERKREQVLKSIDKTAFLDVLMGGSKSISVDNDVKNETHKNEKHEKKKKTKEIWNVLRDDFVMGTKLKDWDRKSQDEDSSTPENSDSDD